MEKFREILEMVLRSEPLPRDLKDHPLKGSWKGYRDLHIEPDWLLIYKVDTKNVWLTRTGSHADIFNH